MNNVLLEAALEHHFAGSRVLPVRPNKKPHCGRSRQWIEKPPQEQTEEQVRQLFSNGAYGLAVIQDPGSPYATIDPDGIHAEAARGKTGIVLVRTAKSYTPHGEHWIYRTPTDTKFTRPSKAACSSCRSRLRLQRRCRQSEAVRRGPFDKRLLHRTTDPWLPSGPRLPFGRCCRDST